MISKEKIELVKSRVTIADYFNEIIIPDMGWYYNDGYTADLNIREVIKCPFHSEVTPSFRYYPETNSYYCWGCAKGGDVIRLHRDFMVDKGDDVSFATAVDFLYEVFIEGSISKAQNINKVKKKVEYENKGSDVIIFKIETSKIEDKLLRDDKISKESKYIIYRLMDDADRLIRLNMIDAKKALKDIKDTFERIYNKRKIE